MGKRFLRPSVFEKADFIALPLFLPIIIESQIHQEGGRNGRKRKDDGGGDEDVGRLGGGGRMEKQLE